MESEKDHKYSNTEIFDYKVSRFLVGLVAVSIPLVVWAFAGEFLPSISASYYSESRDIFVGMLFIIGAFLLAYNGHTDWQKYFSKVAAISAFAIALFPTHVHGSDACIISYIHSFSTALFFIVLIYFCFVPFQINTKGKGGKKQRRSNAYFTAGVFMIASLGVIFYSHSMTDTLRYSTRITFWAESVALFSFGCAWLVAGKWNGIPYFCDKEEGFYIMPNK